MRENIQFIDGLISDLKKHGYDCTLKDGEISVSKNGFHVLDILSGTEFRVPKKAISDIDYLTIKERTSELKSIYDLYFSSESLELQGLQNFHKLSEFDSFILAAKLNDFDNTLQFATWQLSPDKTAANLGHYFDDYRNATEDFATRSGMVDKRKLFTETEMKLIRQGLVSLPCNFPTQLSSEQLKTIGTTLEKIEMLVPEIQEHEQLEEHALVPDDELSL